MADLKLILVDPKPALSAAWYQHFADLPNVEIVTVILSNYPNLIVWSARPIHLG